MARQLKVYRTAAGFHDAYVAAPSQKAALAAWGSARDLFARGDAEIVTDAALAAEPLAHPGTVIRRSRGTPGEQLAALPPDAPRAKAKPAEPAPAKRMPAPPPKPRPSPDALDAAETALDALRIDQHKALAELEKREAALARERRALERDQAAALNEAQRERDGERARYDAAMHRWKGG